MEGVAKKESFEQCVIWYDATRVQQTAPQTEHAVPRRIADARHVRLMSYGGGDKQSVERSLFFVGRCDIFLFVHRLFPSHFRSPYSANDVRFAVCYTTNIKTNKHTNRHTIFLQFLATQPKRHAKEMFTFRLPRLSVKKSGNYATRCFIHCSKRACFVCKTSVIFIV